MTWQKAIKLTSLASRALAQKKNLEVIKEEELPNLDNHSNSDKEEEKQKSTQEPFSPNKKEDDGIDNTEGEEVDESEDFLPEELARLTKGEFFKQKKTDYEQWREKQIKDKQDYEKKVEEAKHQQINVIEDDYEANELVTISMDVYNLTIAANMTKNVSQVHLSYCLK